MSSLHFFFSLGCLWDVLRGDEEEVREGLWKKTGGREKGAHFCGAKFQRPSLRQWRLSSAGPWLTDLLWCFGRSVKAWQQGVGVGGRCRHGEGGHEGGPDGERVLLALGVDRDDLALADVLGDGAASAREALAHALRAREHWVCRKEVG